MYDRPKISSLCDHENSWAKVERDSHLPFGTFDRDDRHGHTAVAIVCVVAVVLFALGAFAP